MLGFSRYFWLCSILFTLNQLIEKLNFGWSLTSSYLDDLVCPGIVLGIALFIQQQFTFRNRKFQLPISSFILFVIWYSVLFEYLLPKFDSRHYSDPWDILMYSLGSIAFYFLGNKNSEKLFFFKEK